MFIIYLSGGVDGIQGFSGEIKLQIFMWAFLIWQMFLGVLKVDYFKSNYKREKGYKLVLFQIVLINI